MWLGMKNDRPSTDFQQPQFPSILNLQFEQELNDDLSTGPVAPSLIDLHYFAGLNSSLFCITLKKTFGLEDKVQFQSVSATGKVPINYSPFYILSKIIFCLLLYKEDVKLQTFRRI